MAGEDAFRERARASWAAGDWDGFSRVLAPVGQRVLEQIALEPGMDGADVGTGSGGTVAIPAAQRGATVVGVDITPELFQHAKSRRSGESRSMSPRRSSRRRACGDRARDRRVRLPSREDAVNDYMRDFGPFVTARRALEPQGRWPEFVEVFTTLVDRFDGSDSGGAEISVDWLLITAER
jgi:hypothetical protein